MTSVYILCPGWHKQPSKMRVSYSQVQTKKSAETLKWVSSSLRENCTFTLWMKQENETAAKLQRYNAVYRISQKGHWRVAFLGSEQSSVAFFFQLVKPFSPYLLLHITWMKNFQTDQFFWAWSPNPHFLQLLCKITISSVCLMTARGTCSETLSEQKKTSTLPEFCLLWPMAHIRVSKFDFVCGEFPVNKPSQTFHCHYNTLTITIHKSAEDREIGIFY